MRLLFSRRWFQLTVIVMAALAILVNLGFWQLERLAQRRYFNNRVLAQINRSPLELTAAAGLCGFGSQPDFNPGARLRFNRPDCRNYSAFSCRRR